MKKLFILFTMALALVACNNRRSEEKGFQVSKKEENNEADGFNRDSIKMDTRPSSVLLTGFPNIRLTTIYKVNVVERNHSTFIGSNHFHYRSHEVDFNNGNNWNNNIMPGLEAVYGFKMVNVSHYDIKENKQKNLFEKPVLIRTLYYPTLSKDTLNYKAITREYIMVSVYNEDSNKDNFINLKDLRRMYLFNLQGEKQKALIPENYSVYKSEYDGENDLMYVFAQLDKNNNGNIDAGEPAHVFWIDLKDPNKSGRLY